MKAAKNHGRFGSSEKRFDDRYKPRERLDNRYCERERYGDRYQPIEIFGGSYRREDNFRPRERYDERYEHHKGVRIITAEVITIHETITHERKWMRIGTYPKSMRERRRDLKDMEKGFPHASNDQRLRLL